MGIANKLNSGRRQTVAEGIDTKSIEYLSVEEFVETAPDFPVSLAGFFIKTGEYGEQITIIVYNNDGEPVGLNIPKRYVDMFNHLSTEEIEEIKSGKLALSSITPGVKTPKGKTNMLEFVDLD